MIKGAEVLKEIKDRSEYLDVDTDHSGIISDYIKQQETLTQTVKEYLELNKQHKNSLTIGIVSLFSDEDYDRMEELEKTIKEMVEE